MILWLLASLGVGLSQRVGDSLASAVMVRTAMIIPTTENSSGRDGLMALYMHSDGGGGHHLAIAPAPEDPSRDIVLDISCSGRAQCTRVMCDQHCVPTSTVHVDLGPVGLGMDWVKECEDYPCPAGKHHAAKSDVEKSGKDKLVKASDYKDMSLKELKAAKKDVGKKINACKKSESGCKKKMAKLRMKKKAIKKAMKMKKKKKSDKKD